MLQINNLTYGIGERELLKNVTLVIHTGIRAALIGPNGAGKTTLFRIIIGEIPTNAIIKPKEYRIGYLPQEQISVGAGPILDYVMAGHHETVKIQKYIQEINFVLQDQNGQNPELVNRLGFLEERFDMLGGYQLESSAKSILSGLGFSPDDFNRPLSDLSGGWRMRVYLARILLIDPDLLLLDEPTNHLDLPSLEWLEQYLQSLKGSLIIISHDRFFIDRLADEIYELEYTRLAHYPGNYHFYEKQKALQRQQLEKKWQQLRAEREKQQKFIDRFRYKATKAAQVQSRIKQLDKLEQVELPPPPPAFNFKVKVATPSYKDVVKIERMCFRYESNWVLENIDLNIYRGDRIALVGANGAGKTTLTRLIFGQLKPQKGNVRTGERVEMGYYAQHQVDTLNLEASIYDEVASTTQASLHGRIRDVLGLFQFRGEDVFKTMHILSGGEKARISLAKILLSPVNFLIMDEPTNHLDKTAKEALESALGEYDGTLLVISHDRYFLDKLVYKVIELKDGKLRTYEGNYSDYLEKRGNDRAPAVHKSSQPLKTGRKTKEQKRLQAEARQAVSKERNRLEREIKTLEEKVARLEQEKSEFETAMANPDSYKNGEQVAVMQRNYIRVKAELELLMEEWANAHIVLENILNTLEK